MNKRRNAVPCLCGRAGAQQRDARRMLTRYREHLWCLVIAIQCMCLRSVRK